MIGLARFSRFFSVALFWGKFTDFAGGRWNFERYGMVNPEVYV